MCDENSKKSELSWSRTLVRKLFNVKSKTQDLHANDVNERGLDEETRTNFSERETWLFKKNKKAHSTGTQDYRIFVATWNVGGKSPPGYLNLEDWLYASPPADIYVLGFQEIVPLNAGNVLGAEDNGPERKWTYIIGKTLNDLPDACGYVSYHTPSPVSNPIAELNDDFKVSIRQTNSSFFHQHSFQSISHSLLTDGDMMMTEPALDGRFSVCDQLICKSGASDFDRIPKGSGSDSSDDENVQSHNNLFFSPISYGYGVPTSMEYGERSPGDLGIFWL